MTDIELRQRKSRYNKAYYERHKQQVREKTLTWYYEHKEYRAAYMKAYNRL